MELTCPYCNHHDHYSYHSSIDSSFDKEHKELLMAEDLNVVKCLKCRKELQIETELLYHDTERLLMFNYYPSEVESDRIKRFMVLKSMKDPETLEAIKSGYKLRYVWTKKQLIEKIRIFESGLDDRLIEPFKFSLKIRNPIKRPSIAFDDIRFDGMDILKDCLRILFINGVETDIYSVPIIELRSFALVYGDLPPSDSGWTIIDEEYGKSQFLKLMDRLKQGDQLSNSGT